MNVAPGETVTLRYGAEQDNLPVTPDSAPTAVLYRNGAASVVTPSVSATDKPEEFTFTFTVGAWSTGDILQIRATVVIEGETYIKPIWEARVDSSVSSRAPDTAIYHADIQFTRDQVSSKDEWTVTWFRNGIALTSGITSPQLQVIKRADGTDLIATSEMVQVGGTGSFKLDEDTSRLTIGEAAIAVAMATIDSETRTFKRIIGRDS